MTDQSKTAAPPDGMFHEHRRPSSSDFEGKRVTLFECDCDNVWRIWFDDGSAFAIQCDAADGIPFMELCDECVARPVVEGGYGAMTETQAMYRMAIYAAVATMHFYRDDIVVPAYPEGILGFAQRNSEVIERVIGEVRHYFGYELSRYQIRAAIGAYFYPLAPR